MLPETFTVMFTVMFTITITVLILVEIMVRVKLTFMVNFTEFTLMYLVPMYPMNHKGSQGISITHPPDASQ
jgi:ammonia channel protein AmtB